MKMLNENEKVALSDLPLVGDYQTAATSPQSTGKAEGAK